MRRVLAHITRTYIGAVCMHTRCVTARATSAHSCIQVLTGVISVCTRCPCQSTHLLSCRHTTFNLMHRLPAHADCLMSQAGILLMSLPANHLQGSHTLSYQTYCFTRPMVCLNKSLSQKCHSQDSYLLLGGTYGVGLGQTRFRLECP